METGTRTAWTTRRILQTTTDLAQPAGWQTLAPFTGTGRREGVLGDSWTEDTTIYRLLVPEP